LNLSGAKTDLRVSNKGKIMFKSAQLRTSMKGVDFIARHEGLSLRAYQDVAGVWTIGYGHTAAAGGVKPKQGMRITKEQAQDILMDDLRLFEARVNKTGVFKAQAPFDAAVSFDFNTGAIHRASWVRAYARHDYSGARNGLMQWVKAGGRVVKGLVNRRKAEVQLLINGDYGGGEALPAEAAKSASAKPSETVKEAQGILTAKGFNPGAIDGWFGEKTRAALIEYQKAHPHLTADGILGPATLAQLRRDAGAAKDALSKGGGAVGAGGLLSALAGLPWPLIVGLLILGAAAYFAWRYRDVIARRVNTLLRREVP
jgi:lysozyme